MAASYGEPRTHRLDIEPVSPRDAAHQFFNFSVRVFGTQVFRSRNHEPRIQPLREHAIPGRSEKFLRQALVRTKGKWLLSYNDDPWLVSLYRRHGIYLERVSVPYSVARTGRQRVQELLIRNY